MKVTKKNRQFKVGKKNSIKISHVANISLKKDEMVTFKDDAREFDFGKKNWGYYGSPSLNKRLKSFGYMAALVKNKVLGTYNIMTVNVKKKEIFLKYLKSEDMRVICWVNVKNLKKIEKLFS